MKIMGTTILGMRAGGRAAIGGDGQVTMEHTVIKHNANKIRTLADGKVLAGFAGSTADAFTLFEKFEEKLEKYNRNLPRAAVELAKEWRSDRVLRRLEALLAVIDGEAAFIVSGTGDVVEPEDDILAIGSGGPSGRDERNRTCPCLFIERSSSCSRRVRSSWGKRKATVCA